MIILCKYFVEGLTFNGITRAELNQMSVSLFHTTKGLAAVHWERRYLLPAATKLGQGNIFTSVCLSTGGGCLPQCMLGYPPQAPRTRHPPWSRHPPGAGTPPPGSRLQHTVNERPVRILLECILVVERSVMSRTCIIFSADLQ